MRAAIKVGLPPSRLCLLLNGSACTASRTSRRDFSSTVSHQATWGFIGLGRMGYFMAENLRAKIPKNDTLIIYDSKNEITSKFAKEAGSSGKGASVEIGRNPREVAEKSTTIITALPEPSHVKDVFHCILSKPLPSAEPERLFIDTSTIDPTSSRSVADAVHSTSSGRFVDAPMSGGSVGAEKGTLTFMLGAGSLATAKKSSSPSPSTTALIDDRITPTLRMMGARVLHMGPQGAGLSAKLANNYLLAISMIATAEAMTIGAKAGLDAKKLGELINSSTGRCWSSEVNNPVPGVSEGAPAGKEYAGGFGVSLMKKDLRLAIEAAKGERVHLEMADKAMEVYTATEKEEAGKDFSVVYRWLGRQSD